MPSTIITTNLAFSWWNEIIPDKVLINALVDRLTHKAKSKNHKHDRNLFPTQTDPANDQKSNLINDFFNENY